MDTRDATLGHEVSGFSMKHVRTSSMPYPHKYFKAAAYAEQCRQRRNIVGVLEGHRKAAHHFARARDKSTSEAVKVAMDEYVGPQHISTAI